MIFNALIPVRVETSRLRYAGTFGYTSNVSVEILRAPFWSYWWVQDYDNDPEANPHRRKLFVFWNPPEKDLGDSATPSRPWEGWEGKAQFKDDLSLSQAVIHHSWANSFQLISESSLPLALKDDTTLCTTIGSQGTHSTVPPWRQGQGSLVGLCLQQNRLANAPRHIAVFEQ